MKRVNKKHSDIVRGYVKHQILELEQNNSKAIENFKRKPYQTVKEVDRNE